MDKLLLGGVSLQLVKWGTASRDRQGLVYLYRRGRRLHLRSGVQGAAPKLIATARASSSSNGDALPAAVAVRFVLQRECSFGQGFNVVGDDPLLGGWDPDSIVPMEWSEGHIWTCDVELPAGKRYEYKFLLKGAGSRLEWQPGPNRRFDTGTSSGNSSLTIVGDWDGEESPLPVFAAAERGTQEGTATAANVDWAAGSIAEETSILDAVEELVKPAEEQGGFEESATEVSDPAKAIDPSEGTTAASPGDPADVPKEPAAAVTDDPVEDADADLRTVGNSTRAQSTPPLAEGNLEVVEASCGKTRPGENSKVLNGDEESTVEAHENSVGVNKQGSDPCLVEDSRGYITFRF